MDYTRLSRHLDAADPGPGFGGMDMGSAEIPAGHFLGWTPGAVPDPGVPDMAWRLESGSDLVLQLHMLPRGKPEAVQPRIGLYFAAAPPTRIPFGLVIFHLGIDIPAGVSDYQIEDTYELPVDVEVLGVYPHAHYVGKKIHGLATLPDGTQQWLIRIDDWDFNWQDDYSYVDPPQLPAGTEISMRYVFDNSVDNPFNPNMPPKRVAYGLLSSDEMGDLILQVLPKDPADLPRLLQDVNRKWLAQEIQGHQMLLRADPEDFENHHTLAMYYLQDGRIDSAFVHFEATLQLQPAYPEAHVNLAGALAARGQPEAAIRHLRQAIEDRPGFASAHFNLGLILHSTGQRRQARQHFETAARLRPEMAAAIRRTMAGLGD